ncbi:MAG: hypothetical protein J6J87_04630 [Oscillospiraceae bacterium]|nr:hypothetical protein [Oscillospiraceae bacterium]
MMEDIPKAADWFVQAMGASGYVLDGTIGSFRELDRFIDEQKRPGGILDGKVGSKLFAMGAYVGQTLVAQLGGRWETDDQDPEGEINIAVCMDRGKVWPVQRVMKRFSGGPEDSLYGYGMELKDMEN